MYKYRHKVLNHEVYVRAYQGKLTKHRLDSINGSVKCYDYEGRIDEVELKDRYELIEEVKDRVRWNLVWMIGGEVKETIVRGGLYGYCSVRKKELKRTSHKSGLLVIVRV